MTPPGRLLWEQAQGETQFITSTWLVRDEDGHLVGDARLFKSIVQFGDVRTAHVYVRLVSADGTVRSYAEATTLTEARAWLE